MFLFKSLVIPSFFYTGKWIDFLLLFLLGNHFDNFNDPYTFRVLFGEVERKQRIGINATKQRRVEIYFDRRPFRPNSSSARNPLDTSRVLRRLYVVVASSDFWFPFLVIHRSVRSSLLCRHYAVWNRTPANKQGLGCSRGAMVKGQICILHMWTTCFVCLVPRSCWDFLASRANVGNVYVFFLCFPGDG